MNDAETKQTHS